MFTGIIEESGIVVSVKKAAMSAAVTIRGTVIFGDLRIGDSVAVNGVCLTVSSLTDYTFTADVMRETLSRSNLGTLKTGVCVNLERAMTPGGRFGGHIVSGHIDGTGIVTGIKRDDNAVWLTIEAPPRIMRYIVEKGSVAIDGISLTVARVNGGGFSVSVIPHTMGVTMLSKIAIGNSVNIENDIIGKYVERLMRGGAEEPTGGVTLEVLSAEGFI